MMVFPLGVNPCGVAENGTNWPEMFAPFAGVLIVMPAPEVCGVTLIVTEATAVKLPLLAVSVYVVVWAGATETLFPVTVPTPEILREVALLVDQERVADCPATMEPGDAVKLEIEGLGVETGFTVTVTL